MMVAFIPMYLDILGAESYGLVGIMLSLQAMSMLLDFGFGGAVNREIARRTASFKSRQSLRSLVRTFEWVVWPLSVIIGVVFFLSSEFLASHWLIANDMHQERLVHCLGLIAIVVATVWPSHFYTNCLSGLQQLPLLNLVTVIFATLRSAGVLLVLFWVSPSIEAFLWWYIFIGVLQSVFLGLAIWGILPSAPFKASFIIKEFSVMAKFAGGLFLSSLLGLALTQLDRLLLSGLRPLSEIGYYTVALSVAAGINRIIHPMFNAVYPRFSQLVIEKNTIILTDLYHQSAQLIAVFVAAVAAVLIVFSDPILMCWINDEFIVSQVNSLVKILVASTSLYGFFILPYALQLANGWIRLNIVFNFFCLLVGIPLCFFAVSSHGVLGAAIFIFILNFAWVFIAVPLMHRRLLIGHFWRWFLVDSLPPVLCAFSAALACSYWLPPIERSFNGLLLLMIIAFVVLVFAAFSVKTSRSIINGCIMRIIGKVSHA